MAEIRSDLKQYWTLVRAHRRQGSSQAFSALELLATGFGKVSQLAQRYIACEEHNQKAKHSDAS